jgi:PilZ domain
MSSIRNWFEKFSSSDKRKAKREVAQRLVAFFWNGGAPTPYAIRDISSTGFYLVTEERWHPGTMITMTLQRSDTGTATPENCLAILSKVVRLDDHGVGFAFVLQEETSRTAANKRRALAGKKALESFLQRLKSDVG